MNSSSSILYFEEFACSSSVLLKIMTFWGISKKYSFDIFVKIAETRRLTERGVKLSKLNWWVMGQ